MRTPIQLQSTGRVPKEYGMFWMEYIQNDFLALKNAIEFLTNDLTYVGYTSGPITLSPSARLVMVDATSANIVVNLPTAESAVQTGYHIIKTDATANTVTLTPSGSETINGAATLVLASQWDSPHIASTGTEWVVI